MQRQHRDAQVERDLIVQYLRRQVDGCTATAIRLDASGDDVMALAMRSLARTIEVLSDRIEAGAHRHG